MRGENISDSRCRPCGKSGQVTPNGLYNLERTLKSLVSKNIPIGACRTCMDARGLKLEEMAQGICKSTMKELTDWTIWADKLIVFKIEGIWKHIKNSFQSE